MFCDLCKALHRWRLPRWIFKAFEPPVPLDPPPSHPVPVPVFLDPPPLCLCLLTPLCLLIFPPSLPLCLCLLTPCACAS